MPCLMPKPQKDAHCCLHEPATTAVFIPVAMEGEGCKVRKSRGKKGESPPSSHLQSLWLQEQHK